MICRKSDTSAAGAAVALALAGVAALLASPPSPRKAHRLEMRELSFRPLELQVARGDTVTWTNDDLVPHTVTAIDGRWDSGEIPPGGTFTIVVETAGTVPYDCRYHPVMVGVLRSPP